MSHSTTLVNSSEPDKPLSVIHLPSCIKLSDAITYKQWAAAIRSTLQGYLLFSYLDGTQTVPPQTIPSNTAENPAYMTWYRQDQLILGALFGTLTPSVAALVVHAKTSHEAWSTLRRIYANPSRGHILQIKAKLASTKLENKTITEYMQAIKSCTDDLAQLDKAMDNEDILMAVFNGLDQDLYKPVLDVVKARDTPISFDALHEKLIQHELLIQHNNTTTTSSPFMPSANYTTRPPTTPKFNTFDPYFGHVVVFVSGVLVALIIIWGNCNPYVTTALQCATLAVALIILYKPKPKPKPKTGAGAVPVPGDD